MTTTKFRLTKSETTLLTLITLFLGVILAIFAWWQSLNANPNVVVPAPTALPQLNAYDQYVKALKLIVPHTGTPTSVTIEGLYKFTDPSDHASLHPPTHPSPAMLQLMQDNAPAFAAVRQGFKYPFVTPAVRSFNAPTPDLYQHYGTLAHALIVEGYVKELGGDWAGAANCYIDAERVGEDFLRGGTLIPVQAGLAIDNIAEYRIWVAYSHLNGAAARAATRRMEDIIVHHYPFAEVLQGEKWQTQAALMELFHHADWQKHSVQFIANDKLITPMQIYTLKKRKTMSEYTKFMDGCITTARAKCEIRKGKDEFPQDPLAHAITQRVDRIQGREFACALQQVILAVQLSLQAYYAEHARYPGSLDDLMPSYLTTLHTDIATGLHIKYSLHGKGYRMLFSWPNGTSQERDPIR